MEIKLQQLLIPDYCKILKNSFSTYDPEIDYSEEKNLFYLSEDLLQIKFGNLIIDLGWYGEIGNNDGEFKIFVIENQNWENPIIKESSKSQRVIKGKAGKYFIKLYESQIHKLVKKNPFFKKRVSSFTETKNFLP